MQSALQKGPQLVVDNDTVVAGDAAVLMDQLEKQLVRRRIKLRRKGISTFQTWDFNRRRNILFLGFQTPRPYCLVGIGLASELGLLDKAFRRFTVTMSTTRTFAQGVPQLLGMGTVDVIHVLYGGEECAVIVDAVRLMNQLRG